MLFGALLFVIYFIPAFIARGSKHPRMDAIAILNLLLGWTVLGWIGALIWALSKPTPQPEVLTRPLSLAEELARLDKMWDKGTINNAQYLRMKDDLLKSNKA